MNNENTKPLPPLTAAEIAELRRQYDEYHNSGYEPWANVEWCNRIEDKFDRLLAAAEREGRLREAIVAAIDGLESGMFHFKQSGLDTEGRYAMNSIANALANLKIRYAKISERAE